LQKKYHIWIDTGNKFHVLIRKHGDKNELKTRILVLFMMVIEMIAAAIDPGE